VSVQRPAAMPDNSRFTMSAAAWSVILVLAAIPLIIPRDWHGPGLTVQAGLLLLLLAAVAAAAASRWRRVWELTRRDAAVWLTLAAGVWIIGVTVWHGPWPVPVSAASLWLLIVLFWAGLVAVWTSPREWPERLLRLLVVLAIAEAAVGVLSLGIPGLLATLRELFTNPDSRVTAWRIAGTIRHPNLFAGFLVIGGVLGFGAFLASLRDRGRPLTRWLLGGGVLLVLAALFLSLSRGAWLGLLGGGGLVLMCRWWGRRRWLPAALAGLALLAVAGQGVFLAARFYRAYFDGGYFEHVQRNLMAGFTGAVDLAALPAARHDLDRNGALDAAGLVIAAHGRQAFQERYADQVAAYRNLWRGDFWQKAGARFRGLLVYPDGPTAQRLLAALMCAELMIRHPVAGVGPGNYGRVAGRQAYDQTDRTFIDYHSHSLPLQLGVEFGWAGWLLWAALAAGFIRTLVVYFRGSVRPVPVDAVFFLAWAVAATGVHNLVDITILANPLRVVFPLLAAVFWAAARRETGGPPEAPSVRLGFHFHDGRRQQGEQERGAGGEEGEG